jgi:transposase
MDFEWVYVFGSVCPSDGRCHSCLISRADTMAMNGYLEDFSRSLAEGEHALLVLDRAGWHRSKGLKIPGNVTLLWLPPYSPQLNPAELIWRQMRARRLSNVVFDTVWQMDKAVAEAWLYITRDVSEIKSLCFFPWIESAVNNLN